MAAAAKKATTRKRGPVRATRTVYLRLPHAMVNQIQEAARARGWTMNRWVETLLDEVLPARLGNGKDRK